MHFCNSHRAIFNFNQDFYLRDLIEKFPFRIFAFFLRQKNKTSAKRISCLAFRAIYFLKINAHTVAVEAKTLLLIFFSLKKHSLLCILGHPCLEYF